MTQLTTQSPVAVPARPGPTRTAWIAALLAVTAAAVITLVIAVGAQRGLGLDDAAWRVR